MIRHAGYVIKQELFVWVERERDQIKSSSNLDSGENQWKMKSISFSVKTIKSLNLKVFALEATDILMIYVRRVVLERCVVIVIYMA